MIASAKELVTIGITCFNAQDTIARAIESALAQTWENTEIIVIDDNSTDSSASIIEEYVASRHIRLIRNHENRGVAANRQALVDNAKGSYIAYLDDDDWAMPDRIENQMNRLLEHAKICGHNNVFCYGDRIMIKDGKETILHGVGRIPKEPYGAVTIDMIFGKPAYDGYTWGLMGAGTMLASVATIQGAGGFDPSFRRSAEIDLAVRAAAMGAAFVSAPVPVIRQYYTAGVEKSLWKMGQYQLKLILKHLPIVLSRGLLFHALSPFVNGIKKKLGRGSS